jgi:TonB family protein
MKLLLAIALASGLFESCATSQSSPSFITDADSKKPLQGSESKNDDVDKFMQSLETRIKKHWTYPREAIVADQQGTTILKLTILKSGKIQNVGLVSSSGSKILDENIIDAIKKVGQTDPFPEVWKPAQRINIMGSFQYIMSGRPSLQAQWKSNDIKDHAHD